MILTKWFILLYLRTNVRTYIFGQRRCEEIELVYVRRQDWFSTSFKTNFAVHHQLILQNFYVYRHFMWECCQVPQSLLKCSSSCMLCICSFNLKFPSPKKLSTNNIQRFQKNTFPTKLVSTKRIPHYQILQHREV